MLKNIFSSNRSPLPSSSDDVSFFLPLQRELRLILKEIKVITERIKDDEVGILSSDWSHLTDWLIGCRRQLLCWLTGGLLPWFWIVSVSSSSPPSQPSPPSWSWALLLMCLWSERLEENHIIKAIILLISEYENKPE